ncbi:protocadherin-16-like [Gadus chalcogrammus]|uniref:protocadherin-16-like n=1 Tax=Gadus chalcogrammus TaxID=1042646 RepID=UPI0024C4B5F2|nr:protocadherin-16-like [Gadus chalcogrammus]
MGPHSLCKQDSLGKVNFRSGGACLTTSPPAAHAAGWENSALQWENAGVESSYRLRSAFPLGGSTGSAQSPDWYLVRVEMTVSDVNDNVPEWSMVPVPYLAVVSPDAVPGSLVYQLLARDDDGGDNGEVEFFLSDGGDGRLEVDRKSGQVRTTGLPLQRDREYLLTVVAADRLGSRSAPATVSVVAGPRPPQFSNASFTIAIPENTPEGQPFLTTPALSFQKEPISYSLLINPSSLFSISAESGEISLTRSIDYEGDQHRYLLLVRANEGVDSLSSAAEFASYPAAEQRCRIFQIFVEWRHCGRDFHLQVASRVLPLWD